MKQPLKQYNNIDIIADTIEGKGIAHIEQKVVFIQRALSGDQCDIQMKKSFRRHSEASVIQIHKSSEDRAAPHCNHYELCGGCSLQHMNYKKQLLVKETHVKDSLERIGKVTYKKFNPIIGAIKTEYYRNKLDFAFSSKRWLTVEEIQTLPENAERTGLGFHLAGMFDKVLDLNYCYHQDERSNTIRNFVKEKSRLFEIPFYDVRNHEGVLRNLIIRNTTLDEWMVILCFTELNDATKTLLEAIKEEFLFITSLMYTVNTKKNDVIYDLEIVLFSGKDAILESLDGFKFKIRPKSFFQTNSQQAAILYQEIVKIAAINKSDIVYDLYTGVGSIAIYIANLARKVVGIELIEDAIKDAKENALLNQVDNLSFFASDIKNMLDDTFIEQHGKPDIIITDPPRAGMEVPVLEMLLKMECPKIVYVSCNPGTQARDLAILQEKYTIELVQPVDMFPHTAHVESIALLLLK